jgi:hypothetical protein
VAYPLFYSTYINKILKEWKLTVNTGILLKKNTILNIVHYIDDQALTAKSEDGLQTVANHLNITAKIHNMKISITKTKATRICENNIHGVKTELDGKITERVSEFKYLGNIISFDNKGIEFKIKTYNKTNGIIKVLEKKSREN